MHRRLLVALAALLIAAVHPAAASAANTIDLSGGYSFARIVNDPGLNIPNGWFATVGFNVLPMVDVVADFSGAYKTDSTLGVDVSNKMHSYLVGPRYRWKQAMMPVSVYGQVLFGGQTDSSSASGLSSSETNFAFAPGGGVDVRIAGPWAARGGINYRLIRPSGGGSWEKVLQVIGGIVYNVP
jgi:hypothetical protein